MFGRLRRSEEIVGFALSGGGPRGASQVGGLRALVEGGIRPQLVAGTSAGAINASWFALYPEKLEQLEGLWLAQRRRDIFPGNVLSIFINMSRRGFVHPSDAMEAFLRRQIGFARFEDCKVPLAIVAARLSDGERVVFESGEIVPAVMASSAIPGVFPPYRIGDELYVDGGILEYLPVPSLIERGATTIYALDCSYFAPGAAGPLVDRAARIGVSHTVRQVTSLSGARGRKVHLLRPVLPETNDPRDFDRTAEMIQAGYEHGRQYLREQAAIRQQADQPSGAG